MRINSSCAIFGVALFGGACGSEGGGGSLDDASPVINNYAALVFANYSDAVSKTNALKPAVDALISTPSQATLDAAKQAWLDAREPYGQTEVFRFYDGPIDDNESFMNAWPLDEVYIDYVVGSETAGIINDATAFPVLSKEVLADRNEKDGEKNISTGFHAIEFLLWGQDVSATGPGNRPFTDYAPRAAGNASNPERRGQYLSAVTEMLTEQLAEVREAWADNGSSNYGKSFRAGDPREMVRRMLQGMGSLAGAELSGERMRTAYDNKDQEDEHSCFSDNTHRDLLNNALGIQNVYLGQYGQLDGPGLDDLVKARDATLDAKMKQQLATSLAAIAAIPSPFDQAILGGDASPGRVKVLAAIRAVQAEAETVVEVATLLGIKLNLE